MPVNLISDEDLRAALRPYRADAAAFEAGVRERLRTAVLQRVDDPLARLSRLKRSAAAFLPLAILTGCKATPASSDAVPAAGAYKLLSYLAFPAISLFVLLGATVFSAVKIRGMREQNGSGLGDEEAVQKAIREWWHQHKWGAMAVFALNLILMMVGATWILFLFYLISFGLLLLALASFAKLGLGNRLVIGRSCFMGLMFLGQASMIVGIGNEEIHFVDQKVVSAIFLGGVLVLMPIVYRAGLASRHFEKTPQRFAIGFMVIVLVPLLAWLLNPYLWPATPSHLKQHVESFSAAPHRSASWQQWEIPASWAIETKLDLELSQPRRLLVEEISGEQNPFVLSSAMRVGLLSADQVSQLKDYQQGRRSLVASRRKPQAILFLAQNDWVIRAAALLDDLSPEERDLLEGRLHATLGHISKSPFDQADVLETALRVTQLLRVIERPIDPDQYRRQVHGWLQKFHSTQGGGFQLAGGFKQYSVSRVGSLTTTSHAVQLMEIYGIPDGLELNWVRAFLRPVALRQTDEKWIAAVTLERLNRLPDATALTWLEILYYERSLLAATVLVGLCIYATLLSPQLKAIDIADGRLAPDLKATDKPNH